jgi:hypothetical protein
MPSTLKWVDGSHTVLRAAINASSSGNNTVISAVASKQIVVISYDFVCAGAVTVTWESSGGSIIGGPQSYAANSGINGGENLHGHFETVRGEGLVLDLSGAVQVGGKLSYVLI